MAATLHISIIQAELAWEDIPQNLAKFSALFPTVHADTQIILLPEMFSTGFSMNVTQLAERMDGRTFQWMQEQAILHRKIIAGSIIIEEAGAYYNRLIWMLPTGQHYQYDKAHLFGKAKEDTCFTAGSKRLIVQVNGWRILLQTCYDLRFPVWARQDKALYDVMINVANWPAQRSEAWKALLKARAIENQVYVLACNVTGMDGNNMEYSGDSAGIDYNGNVLWTAVGAESIGYVVLEKEKLETFRNDFPFLKDRDNFILLD